MENECSKIRKSPNEEKILHNNWIGYDRERVLIELVIATLMQSCYLGPKDIYSTYVGRSKCIDALRKSMISCIVYTSVIIGAPNLTTWMVIGHK